MVRRRALRALLGLAVTCACCWGDADDPAPAPLDECADLDGDGWGVGGACLGDDCDEYDPSRNRACIAGCSADPADFGCPCLGGSVRCYDGPPASLSVGSCHEGVRSCDEGHWSACVGQVLPADEALDWPNGVDDDCDGLVDVLAGDDCWRQSGEPGCAFQCNDPAAPDFRIVGLEVSRPSALASPLTDYGAQTALEGTEWVWLLDTSPDGRFRAGQGRCEPARPWVCSFAPDEWATAGGAWSDDGTDGTLLLPASGSIDVTVAVSFPLGGAGGGQCTFDLTLPLREVTMRGTTAHDGNCIGTRLNDFEPSEWEPGGTLTGKITITDAAAVELGTCQDQTLCDWLSQGGHRGACAESDSSFWPDPPDTDLDGEPAWTVELEFAAIGVLIGEAP